MDSEREEFLKQGLGNAAKISCDPETQYRTNQALMEAGGQKVLAEQAAEKKRQALLELKIQIATAQSCKDELRRRKWDTDAVARRDAAKFRDLVTKALEGLDATDKIVPYYNARVERLRAKVVDRTEQLEATDEVSRSFEDQVIELEARLESVQTDVELLWRRRSVVFLWAGITVYSIYCDGWHALVDQVMAVQSCVVGVLWMLRRLFMFGWSLGSGAKEL